MLATVISVCIAYGCGGVDVATRDQVAAAEAAVMSASRFLSQSQQEDGSWESFRGTADYPEIVPDSRIFLSSIVLANLRGTRFERSPTAERGRSYLISERSDNLLFNFDGRAHEYCCGKYQKTLSALPPDIDDTSLAYLALHGFTPVSAHELTQVVDSYRRFQTAAGTFPTFMIGYYEGGLVDGLPETPMTLQHDLTPSLGANLNALGFFAAYGVENPRFEEGLRRMVRDGPRADPYYSGPVSASFAANALEAGFSKGLSFLGEILTAVEEESAVEDLLRLSTLDLAAYIAAKSSWCANGKKPCLKLLAPLVAELLARQGDDGSWVGGWVCTIGTLDPEADIENRRETYLESVWPRFVQYGLRNLPEPALESLLSFAVSEGPQESIPAIIEELIRREPSDPLLRRIVEEAVGSEGISERLLAQHGSNRELLDRLYHYYCVYFDGQTFVRFNSPANTTSFGIKALERFLRLSRG